MVEMSHLIRPAGMVRGNDQNLWRKLKSTLPDTHVCLFSSRPSIIGTNTKLTQLHF